MGLLRKKLSFVLIGSSRDKLRQFNISYGLILTAAFIVAFLLTSNLILTTSYINSQVAAHEAERLRMENEHLISKYDELRSDIVDISKYYSELVEKEIAIRNIFNLPEISTDERQLGIGGPDNLSNEQFTKALQVAHSTEAEVDALIRLSHFEQEKYSEVYEMLSDKRELLNHTPSIRPARGYQIRGFGMKDDPFTGYKRFHAGIDIANKIGTPIYATADGVVRTTGRGEDLGKYIVINHGFGYMTKYGHLDGIKVKRGQKIRRGDIIGLMGSTGYSTGPHLHYEVIKNNKKINPVKYILN
ncbi:MAG TPA: M23 family metallopeptidase [candidate division Zixibacteria bacterium]|nr:M23 family metallopeptidase [candidate division Zixibacteria bacterium]